MTRWFDGLSLPFFCLALSSCTSVSTVVESPGDAAQDGIAYYMPLKPIKINVTVSKDKTQTPSLEIAESIPDLSQRYVLNYEKNLVGKNHLSITVGSSGLLMSSNGETESGVSMIAKNIAKAAGSITGLSPLGGAAPSPTIPSQKCQPGQVYSAILFPEKQKSARICNFNVSIQLVGGNNLSPAVSRDTERLKNKGASQSGIFYRHDLPYVVSVTDTTNSTVSQFIAFSPNESEISFLPVTRTFFSNNNSKLTLVSGVVTSVEESSDGEIVALTELPADILSSYFSAIGSIFSSLSTNSQDQQAAVVNAQALALAKIKQQSCQAAILSNPITGKDSPEIQVALNNIKLACS